MDALRGLAAPGPARQPSGAAASVEEYLNMTRGGHLGGEASLSEGASSRGGLALIQRVVRTRQEQPGVVVAAHEGIVRDRLNVLPGESWSWHRYTEKEILPFAGNFKTLRRAAVLVASALDEGRSHSYERQHAFLVQALSVLESASKDPDHDLAWSWPLLGVVDPDGPPRPHLAPAEAHAIAAFHRDESSLLAARRSLGASATPGQGQPTTSTSPHVVMRSEIRAELARQRQGTQSGNGAPAEQAAGKGGAGRGVEKKPKDER